MAANMAAALQRAYENCGRLLILVQEQIANPTQANVDAIVAAAASNPLTPKPTYGLDGESYSWESYKDSLIRNMKDLKELISAEAAPFEVRSRAVT